VNDQEEMARPNIRSSKRAWDLMLDVEEDRGEEEEEREKKNEEEK
jgi:hypothetical protein